MNRNAPSFCVAETIGTPQPGEIKPVLGHLDFDQAHQRAAELRQAHSDKQYAIFDETIGFTEAGLVEDEAGKPPRRQ
jgi:hypothetical protein